MKEIKEIKEKTPEQIRKAAWYRNNKARELAKARQRYAERRAQWEENVTASSEMAEMKRELEQIQRKIKR